MTRRNTPEQSQAIADLVTRMIGDPQTRTERWLFDNAPVWVLQEFASAVLEHAPALPPVTLVEGRAINIRTIVNALNLGLYHTGLVANDCKTSEAKAVLAKDLDIIRAALQELS